MIKTQIFDEKQQQKYKKPRKVAFFILNHR